MSQRINITEVWCNLWGYFWIRRKRWGL